MNGLLAIAKLLDKIAVVLADARRATRERRLTIRYSLYCLLKLRGWSAVHLRALRLAQATVNVGRRGWRARLEFAIIHARPCQAGFNQIVGVYWGNLGWFRRISDDFRQQNRQQLQRLPARASRALPSTVNASARLGLPSMPA
jgi:hypothetical protein